MYYYTNKFINRHWVLEPKRHSQQINCLNKVGACDIEKTMTKNYSTMLNEMEDNYKRLK